MHTIPEPDKAGLRKFAYTLAIAFAVLFGLIPPWILERPVSLWPWVISVVLVIWGLSAPMSLMRFYKIWMRFGIILNRFTSPVLLGVIFYLVITPMGLFLRLIGNTSIKPGFDEGVNSYRIPSETEQSNDMERPF